MARIVRPDRGGDDDGEKQLAKWRRRLQMSPEEYTEWWWGDVPRPKEDGPVSFDVARRQREADRRRGDGQ